MSKYIISLDEGTTSCRTLVINQQGEIISSDALEFSQIFPRAGWVEHDAVEIWNSQRTTLVQSLNKAKIKGQMKSPELVLYQLTWISN